MCAACFSQNTINRWFGCVAIDSVNTPYPFNMEMDYVKVYQPKMACDTSKLYTNATISSFNSKLYKDLTLNTNCYFNNGKVSALGTDFVLMEAGTTIDSNMEMLIDIQPCWTDIKYHKNAVVPYVQPSRKFP